MELTDYEREAVLRDAKVSPVMLLDTVLRIAVERVAVVERQRDDAEGRARLHEHGYCEHSIAHNERLTRRIGIEVARAEAAEAALAAVAKLRDQWRENAGDDRDIESRVLRSVADHIDVVIR